LSSTNANSCNGGGTAHAPVCVEGHPNGKQLCRKGPGDPGDHQVE